MLVRPMLLAAAAVVAASMPGNAQGKTPAPSMAALDQYIAKAARDWHVPALAVAVIKDDSVVLAKGYGVLEVGKPTRADEHTRFAIGSTTKAMTSAALGMLVDEKRISWDDKVIDILPDFRLYDPYVTRELTIRDLLTHRSGLPGTDLLWARSAYSLAEMIRRLRYVEPATSFRSTMEYQNVVYAVGGAIVEKVSGMSWDAFIKSRIFTPLGMMESEPLVAGIIGKANVATPHGESGDSVRPVPIRSTDQIAPAGSVWSSVSDMAKWMRFMLDSGRVGSNRLLSPATFTELVTPQIRAPMALYPALSLARPHGFSYGLGWFVEDYQGQTVWMHTGSIDGMSAIIGLMPDRRVGVYVLANLDHAELRHALMYQVFDLYAGNPPRDWSADLLGLFANARRSATAGATAQRPAATPPSLPLDRYAGRYADPTYGTVEVTLVDGALHARFGTDDLGTLEPRDFESFRAHGPVSDFDRLVLTFVPDGAGRVTAVRLFGATFARTR